MSLKIDRQTHTLQGDDVNFVASPNHSGKFNAGKADTLVIHFTAGSSFDSSVAHLANESAKASAHVVIGRNGQVTQMVPFDTIAWHAGKSHWKGRTGLNHYSIGIELDNAGQLNKNAAGQFVSWFNRAYQPDEVFEGIHRHQSQPGYWHAYTEKQIAATFALCQLLCDTYGIEQIVGHEEIAPKRKTDPGPAFPLDKLRQSIAADRAEDGTDETVNSRQMKKVIATKLNVRGGPDGSFEAISPPLVFGEKVKVIGSKPGWSQIEFTSRGWVSERFLE